MKLKMLEKRNVIIVYCALLVLMVIGTFADYQIDTAINAPGNLFAVVISYFGFYPTVLCLAASMAIFIKVIIAHKTDVVSWVCLVLSIVLEYMASKTFIGLFKKASGATKAVGLIIGFGLAIALFAFILKTMDMSDWKAARKVGLVIFITAGLQLILINKCLKTPWGRPRFRSIISTEGMEFVPWYRPGLTEAAKALIASGVGADEFKSFPSAHTGGAMSLISLVCLTGVIPAFKDREKLFAIIGYVFVGLVMLARMMAGAHFLTDVVAGACVTFTFFLIAAKCSKM